MIEHSISNRDWAASVVAQRVERADCPDNYAYVIDELSCYDQQRMYNGNLFTTPNHHGTGERKARRVERLITMIENSESNRDWAASVVRQRDERLNGMNIIVDEDLPSSYYHGLGFNSADWKPSWQQRAMERYEQKLQNGEIK